ncbi:MAG: WD40 repeat domain-containing protein [Chloroflexota bacterium]
MKRFFFLIFFVFIVSSCSDVIHIPVSITSTNTPPTTEIAPGTATTLPSLPISPDNANRVVELARFGKGVIKQAFWSPDGKTVAVATSVGIYFYDAQTFTETSYIDTGTRITSIAFTPDSKLIAASDDYPYKTIRLWEVFSGYLIQTFEGHSAPVNSISINRQNSILASGGNDGDIRLWNIQTGESIQTIQADGRRVESIAFSEDGTLLVSGSRDGVIQLWNPVTGELTNTFYLPGEFAVMAVAFSPDNRYIASGGNDGRVTLLEAENGEILFSEENYRTTCLTFSPDGRSLASCSDDSTLRIRDIPSGDLISTISVHNNSVTAVSYSNDGKFLLSGSDDGTIKIWESSTSRNLYNLDGFSYYIRDIAVTPDGKELLSSGWKSIQLWDVNAHWPMKTIDIGIGWQDSVAFSLDGRYFSSLGCASVDSYGYCQSSKATVWDFASGNVIQTIEIGENSERPLKVMFSPDANLLITADGYSDKNNIKVWDIATGQLVRVMDGQYLHDIIFGTDSNELITAGLEEIWVRNFSTGAQDNAVVTDKFVDKIALSPDGKIFAIGKMTGNAEGAILIWDIDGKKAIRWLEHSKSGGSIPQIDGIAFSPDGRLLASGASDGTIYLWNTLSWERVAILRHTDIVTRLIFSNDGKLLISSSFDGTIRIWGIGRP